MNIRIAIMMTMGLLAMSAPAQQPQADKAPWRPPEFRDLFTAAERTNAYVQARSFDLYLWPYLDGQWEGIVCDSDGRIWFSASCHDGTQHAQLFRYDPASDQIDHVADVGEACGEKLTGNSPQGKIHSRMFDGGDGIYFGTCMANVYTNHPYRGAYWLKIDKKTGVVTNLGKAISEDSLITVEYDARNKLLYGHSALKGWLTVFDLASGKEKDLGIPWSDCLIPFPRGLTLMIAPDSKVYGAKPPGLRFWQYDPSSGKINNLDVDVPAPAEVTAGNPEAVERWTKLPTHGRPFMPVTGTVWDDKDRCFYGMRSQDEMLFRFYPPTEGKAARFEALRQMGLKDHRFGNRHPSLGMVIVGRTLYYTPYTGWGGAANLQSYDLDTQQFRDFGPIVVEGDRRVNESHSLVAGKDGRLYLVAFVFSIEGKDPVNPWGMRDKYPFHPRFVIIDPRTDCRNAGK